MNVKPMTDHVVIQIIRQQNRIDGVIHIPDNVSKPHDQAKVIHVGPDVKDPMIQPGASVILPRFGGDSFKWNGKEYQIYREDDIIGVISV